MRRASKKAVIGAMLALTGKYDAPGTITVSGYDAYGAPMEETGPNLDWERLEADAEQILQKTGQ